MKNLFLVIFYISIVITAKAQTYPSLNITLLSHLNPETDTTGSDGRKYSGCWGWAQTDKNKEYAIVGTSKQTYFIDVSNPTAPVIVDSVRAAKIGCTWREIKTYKNFCYIVSDDSPPNRFQIIDMQYLPDSVHVVHDGTTYFETSHTIFIDNDKLYCGYVRNSADNGAALSTMRVYSLATPSVPVLIRSLEQDISTSIINGVHDMYVRNDTIYASCGMQGFHILRFTAAQTFSLRQSYTGYPYAGYNHSSWQTDDRKTMVFTDEVSTGLPAKVIDVRDFDNISLVDTIRSNFAATPHNPYIVGNRWCWISTYSDGLYLYDISNPANTTIHGYFDTYPQHGVNDNNYNPPYRGNWGAYPYLPSKIIIATDMQNGIFILDGDNIYKSTVGINEIKNQSSQFSVFPNPAQNLLNIIVANQNGKNVNYTITDILGKVILTGKINPESDLQKSEIIISNIKDGNYFITLQGKSFNETKKIIIHK